MSKIEEIKDLKSLLDQGAITLEEFNDLKKRIIENESEPAIGTTTQATTNEKREEKTILEASKNEDESQIEPKKFTVILTQNIIDEFVATTDEFWSSFYHSLSLPYSHYNSYKDDSFDKWVKRALRSPDLKIHLNVLFDYILLKGEFLIVFYQGFILTNYRLIINDPNAGKPSIPLSNLISYEVNNDCKIVYEKNGQSITLRYNAFIFDTVVNSAKARFKEQQLNVVQLELLSKSIVELKFKIPQIEIKKVDWRPNVETILGRDDYSIIQSNSGANKSEVNNKTKQIEGKSWILRILCIGENFRKNMKAASWLYACCFVGLYCMLKFGDPATYSEKIRKDRADKRYYEATKGKNVNTLRESDYYEMQQALNEGNEAENSPIFFYLTGIIICGGIVFLSLRVLDRS